MSVELASSMISISSSFLGLIVQFGPSVMVVWSKFSAIRFVIIRLSGFGFMAPTRINDTLAFTSL